MTSLLNLDFHECVKYLFDLFFRVKTVRVREISWRVLRKSWEKLGGDPVKLNERRGGGIVMYNGR